MLIQNLILQSFASLSFIEVKLYFIVYSISIVTVVLLVIHYSGVGKKILDKAGKAIIYGAAVITGVDSATNLIGKFNGNNGNNGNGNQGNNGNNGNQGNNGNSG